jgi:hypothetical protein
MKRFWLLAVLLLLIQPNRAGGQEVTARPDRNPERRGIRLLSDSQIRALSAPRKTPKTFPLDERKSIFITDQAILSLFTFDRLMERLAAESKAHKVSKEDLFQQWWDTANLKASFNLPFGGPNCDPALLNTFPYTCPRNEGQQVTANPYGVATPVTYTAIALSNRFDLTTPPDKGGTDCGEYRIVFERNSGGTDALDRSLIIFEAVLPNPKPKLHTLEGCRPVQEFWESLSKPGLSVATRGKMLLDFYFEGLPGHRVEPVFMAKHYGASTPTAEGQIRTNQFMAGTSPQTWMLRQFHIVQDLQGMKIVPVTDAANPPASLFDETNLQPLGSNFRSDFLSQVAALGNSNIDLVAMEAAGQYEDGESIEGGPGGPPTAMNYAAAFANSPSFRAAIQAKLGPGSTLTPDNIIARAQTQTCAGCHQLSINANLGGGLVWPASLGFTQERLAPPFDTTGPDGPRYQISPALQNVFLPFRKHVIETFLQ